ncbi:MAG: hypothetical protein ACYDHM_12225 [Acidiferrobacterales bacterium]
MNINLKKLFYSGCVGLLLSGAAQAASVSYYLNQNNIGLPSNNYGVVTLTDLGGGGVSFTVTPENLTPGTGFGIQKFGFNSTLTLKSSNFNLPSGWSSGVSGNMDGYGSFADVARGTGSSLQNPLTFSVNIGSIADYQLVSSKGYYYAAHIVNFTNANPANQTSAYFASNVAPVPVPAAVWLFGSGLLGLVGVVRRKKT